MKKIGVFFVLVLVSVTARLAAETDFAGPEACAACHDNEYQQWKDSVHAKAYSGPFNKSWKKLGAQTACLACHTTGHKAGSKDFAFEGVTCESCHGALKEGHPETKMALPMDASMCAKCHANTYREWKLSKHGQKNIRCFDCHMVHGQGLRNKNPESLCGSCHPGRLQGFAHATHHEQGLTCLSCHFPSHKGPMEAIEGTGAEAHNLAVGAEVCARCHSETVHRSHKISSLKDEVASLNDIIKQSQAEDVPRLREEKEDLAWKLKQTKKKVLFIGIGAFLAGVIGGALLTLRRGRKGASQDEQQP